MLAQRRAHQREVSLDVHERAGKPHVHDHLAQRGRHARLRRIVGAVAGRLAVEVVGRDRGAHEDEVVVEVGAVQQLGADRVEEGLGELGLAVLRQQRDVVPLDLLPVAGGELGRAELGADALDRLAHAVVVEGDPLARELADRVPVGGLETGLGLLRVVAEQRVVAIEAVADRLGDRDAMIGRAPHVTPPGADRAHHRVSANSSRPISMRRISEVPAPIS